MIAVRSNTTSTSCRAARHRAAGVGLVELLLALSISASVLVAVAYAVDVSFKSYSINQEQSSLMQRARITVHRISTQIRTTKFHQPVNVTPVNDFKAGKIAVDSGIRIMDDSGLETSYKYDPSAKVINCVDFDGNEFVAVRGVEAFSVKFEPMKSPESLRSGGAYDLLMRATISLTVRDTERGMDVSKSAAATEIVSLTASVVPRCNVW